jgi:hypothetical protein
MQEGKLLIGSTGRHTRLIPGSRYGFSHASPAKDLQG